MAKDDTTTPTARPRPLATAPWWPPVRDWLRRHQVAVGGYSLIAAQLAWKIIFLSHFFFVQDDFRLFAVARDHGFGWNYLMWTGGGHLMPAALALAWVVARIGLYNWALASLITVIMLAVASLAAFRLLRVLFGDRLFILIPLVIYLITPITLPDLGWWSAAIQSLPLQAAIFLALTSHLHYVRTGRFGHAVAACAWMAAGMLFSEKGAVVPLLVFAVTSAFLVDGRWPAAIRRCAVRYWRAWLLYGAVLAGYVGLLVSRLAGSGGAPARTPGAVQPYRSAWTFMSELVKNTFVPGAVGGPWEWFPSAGGSVAYAAPPTALVVLAWAAAAAAVVASIWRRGYAWRAWAILAGWLLAADVAPVALGQIRQLSAAVLGLETRYVADAAPVLAICMGLAFWPPAGRPDTRRPHPVPEAAAPALPRVVGAALGACLLGSVWSAQQYESATTVAAARTFIANARAALDATPYGTVIVDQQVPQTLMLGVFGGYAYSSKVVGEMVRGKPRSEFRWTRQPHGTIDNLYAFGRDGRLRPAGIVGAVSEPLPPGKCWPGRGRTIVVRLRSQSPGGTSVVRVAYFALAAGEVTIDFAGQMRQLGLEPGLHNAYLPMGGMANAITLTWLGSQQLCVGDAAAGVLLPSNSAPAIPASPVA